ncbi:hypothetical protein C1922_19730 [Stenotrophomonas sp. ZAC14D2_NAIMI4_7]|nr:hypothetical protein C1922_19730 [Stenotrophomonas sp. ZAC14D2_NAIMI4_7]
MDLSHPLEQISERGLLPKHPFPGPVDLPLVSGAFYLFAAAPRRAIAPLGKPAMHDLFAHPTRVLLGNPVQNALLGSDTSPVASSRLDATGIAAYALVGLNAAWRYTQSRGTR